MQLFFAKIFLREFFCGNLFLREFGQKSAKTAKINSCEIFFFYGITNASQSSYRLFSCQCLVCIILSYLILSHVMSCHIILYYIILYYIILYYIILCYQVSTVTGIQLIIK